VGRVENYKGVDLLLAAWQKVSKRVPQAHLNIVGEGADKRQYEALIEREAMGYRVKVVGKVPWRRLMKMYDEAQIVVVPGRWYEPFGRTAAEAMARGKVVIASDRGGPAEILEAAGAEICFKRNDAMGLAKALEQALQMKEEAREEVGKSARRWAVENLAKENIAQEYKMFYEKVIKNKE